MTNPLNKPQSDSNGLWIPFTIIFIGIIISVVFAVQTLKGYRKPRPLLIKPSSIEDPSNLADALSKALYPLKLQNYGVITASDGSDLGEEVKHLLFESFGEKAKSIRLTFTKIDLRQNYDNSKTDCLNTALFNMNRKRERVWSKKFYFCVCTEKEKTFAVYYTQK